MCLTVDEAKALAKWENELRLRRKALEGCSFIEWTVD